MTEMKAPGFVPRAFIFFKHQLKQMKNETKIIAGVVAVAAIGAAVGLVLAATKKDTLTEKISAWFWEFLDKSKEKLIETADNVKDTIVKI